MKQFILKHFKYVLLSLGLIITVLLGILVGIILVYQKGFPQIERLEEIQPKISTIIHDDQGIPIKEYAEENRTEIRREEIPPVLEKAIIASEDNQFYSHWGINFKGTFRAIMGILTGRNRGGGSSITQQLALNLYLQRQRTFSRKFQEILMAIQIEKKYSKDQILTFYCNKIFLGANVYGVAQAARYYFGKPLKDINLAEAALIPTIMPSPNGKYNVFTNPENCLIKRNYVLKRMLELKFIDEKQFKEAIHFPLPRKPYNLDKQELGNYFAEEVRKSLETKFGDSQLYTGGLRVYTTLNSSMQKWAQNALKEGLRALDKRIGWRSKTPLTNIISTGINPEKYLLDSWKGLELEKNGVVEGIILKVDNTSAEVRIANCRGKLDAENAKWTRKNLSKILKPGDIANFRILDIPAPLQAKLAENNFLVTSPGANFREKIYTLNLGLEQEPEVEGAILVVDNKTGEIKAMVGGYSFDKSKWNNATQALRQTGSTIKPIVYTAALENGFTPADIILDEPFSYIDPWTGTPWTPQNHTGDYLGPLTLRRALEKSRNIVTARIAERITPEKIVETCRRFGITSDLKPYISISLGAFEVKLSEMVAAYTVFPNLGTRVKPYLIKKIIDHNNHVLEENFPDKKQVLEKETAFIMNYLLQGVVKNGTAFKARYLNAPIGGKTGTTNDYTNAWFIGFTPSITVGVWVGYDEPRKLGYEETGSKAALPIFINFMEKYLQTYPETKQFKKPSGVVWVEIDKYTGKLVTPDCLRKFLEAFIIGTEPLEYCTPEDHALIKNYYGNESDDGNDDGDD